MNEGEKGGKDAADEMLAKVKDHLKSIKIYSEDMDIMVRAYANLKGLAQACVQSGKVKHVADLGLFAVGFTKRQALFDFVDVGAGKERADNKIRGMYTFYSTGSTNRPNGTRFASETLNFYIGNGQCKHVILGCSHDGGYAPALEKFAADDSIRDRVTLLKGGPMHPQIAALGFTKTLTLRTVFGSQEVKKITPARSSVPAVAPAVVPRIAVLSSPGSSSTQDPGSRMVLANPERIAKRLGPILRNEAGQRIDKPLHIDTNSAYIQVLKKSNLCMWYYLRGECTGCDRNHFVGPLQPHEYNCLWYLARSALCWKIQKGKDCDDPRCIYGHRKQ